MSCLHLPPSWLALPCPALPCRELFAPTCRPAGSPLHCHIMLRDLIAPAGRPALPCHNVPPLGCPRPPTSPLQLLQHTYSTPTFTHLPVHQPLCSICGCHASGIPVERAVAPGAHGPHYPHHDVAGHGGWGGPGGLWGGADRLGMVGVVGGLHHTERSAQWRLGMPV